MSQKGQVIRLKRTGRDGEPLRLGERDDEAVALRIDLDAAVPRKALSQRRR
jgi:hypothetical protein